MTKDDFHLPLSNRYNKLKVNGSTGFDKMCWTQRGFSMFPFKRGNFHIKWILPWPFAIIISFVGISTIKWDSKSKFLGVLMLFNKIIWLMDAKGKIKSVIKFDVLECNGTRVERTQIVKSFWPGVNWNMPILELDDKTGILFHSS